MFKVTLEYAIDTPKGPHPRTYTDTWTIKQENERGAINEALSNSQTVVWSRWGYQARVVYEDAVVQPLKECSVCSGSGHRASLEGFYPCPTCQGRKYYEVEQVG